MTTQCETCKKFKDTTCIYDWTITEDYWDGNILHKAFPFEPPCPHYIQNGG